MNSTRALVPFVAATLATTATANAGTRAWDALKAKLPAGTAVIVAADVAAVRGTPSFPKLLEWATTEEQDIGEAINAIKQGCSIDLPAAFDDIAVAVNTDGDGVIAFALTGLDQAKVEGCVRTILTASDPKAKISIKPVGKLTEYAVGSDRLYVAWLAKDILAISTDVAKRDGLDAMLAGAAATGDLGTYVTRAGTKSAVWGAFLVNDDGFKGGYGTLSLGSTLKVALRLSGMTAADGKKGRDELAKAGKDGRTRTAKDPELSKIFSSWKVGGKGAEVTLDLNVPEKSLPALVPALDKVF